MKISSTGKKVVVPGFKFSAHSAGIKKKTKKPDLALIYSERPAAIAGVFTTNKVKAAPVKLDIRRIRSGKGQAIIVNSGNANACTGLQGNKDAREMTEITAKALGIPSNLVYVSSTGKIGEPLPMPKIRKAIPLAAKKLSSGTLNKTAAAIMTTDTVPKMVSKKIKIGTKTGTIAAIAKGAGMISPDMATMLSYFVTDIAVTPKALDSALKQAAKISFNRLAVDNDMSTNDTVMIMANGILGNKPITARSPYYKKFETAVTELAYELAKMIALDGEGSTKLIVINVKGAKTESDAETVGRSIANSMLVKTAIYGCDTNWGRIIAAIGYSGASVREEKISISLNGKKVVADGQKNSSVKIPAGLLKKKEITIDIDLGIGKKSAGFLTCDLTEKYIEINAEYET
jgi:glutamate N-acetyltransferase/amino-acid N-acetyltransferase